MPKLNTVYDIGAAFEAIENELICSDHRGKRSPFIRRSGDYTLLEDEGHDYA